MDCKGLYSFNSKCDCYDELAAYFFSDYEGYCILFALTNCSLDCHGDAPSCHTYRNCYQKGHSQRHCELGHVSCSKYTFAGLIFVPNGSILPYYCYCDSTGRLVENSKPINTSNQYRCQQEQNYPPFFVFDLHYLLSIFLGQM